MSLFLIFFFGFIIGGVIVWLIRRDKTSLKNPSFEEAEKNRKKIIEYFESRGRVSNNEIEELLGVSDSTATRYLDELEKKELIRQVGKTGRSVYYEKTR